MKSRLLKMLDVEPEESGRVFLLLAISFFMGLFLATVTVASQTLFLNLYDEEIDLPKALVFSGVFSIFATSIYNFFQGRIRFSYLAIGSLCVIIGLTAFIEFGDKWIEDENLLYYFGFTLILPFTFISLLVFWGTFNRLFNLRQVKRVIGSVDVGMDIAAILAFFTIPVLLNFGVDTESLFTIGLFSIIGYLVLYIILTNNYLKNDTDTAIKEAENVKLTAKQFLGNKYIMAMSLFIVVSMVAMRFVDYSFFNVTTNKYDENDLPYFLSYFEATIVVFSFFFTTFFTDKINKDYGLRVSLLINPLLLLIFTGGAFALGAFFGFDNSAGNSVIFFFIMIAMSKLFINSMKEAIDEPTFKFYYVPMDKSIKIDAQTKIEGIVMGIGSTLAGGLIVLINSFDIFNLLSVTLFTIPVLLVWYWVTSRMHRGYKETLQSSLIKSKSETEKNIVKEYTMDSVLSSEVNGNIEEKVIYGLKLMEKLEPALFETSVIRLADSGLRKVKQFAKDKISELGIGQDIGNEIRGLAQQAAGEAEDSDLLSISVERLMKLSKSVKQSDRMLAAKLLRKMVSQKTIFILLELLRDGDPKVREEALLTARKVKRPETWNVLIELLSSPSYAHQAASALKEAGEAALETLESAFHKSGQRDLVMLKIVQIMGHIGGPKGTALLWEKADYPDKRIVKQILYSLRYMTYQAEGREATIVKDLLDIEMSKTLWNLAALEELPDVDHFKFLREALKEEVRDNYDQITLLLSLIYDPNSVQLVKENIESDSTDGTAYALELLDLFLDPDLKPKLIPLLDDDTTREKLEKLQIHFPRESYNPVQVINYILNRDFNFNNRWTKLCAVHAIAYMQDFRVSRGLIAQMFNQDKLLQETAAWVIYNKDKAMYETIAERLPFKDKKFLDSSIENNQLLDGLEDGFFLGIEMVMFIKQLKIFKDIEGNMLSDLADKIVPVTLHAEDHMVFNNNEPNPILIVAHGEITLQAENGEKLDLPRGAAFGDLFQNGLLPVIKEATTKEYAVVFKISLADFYFVLANHHELVQKLIKNSTEKELQYTQI
ncbi:MAG TPA: HEAT repeat domain-containing protein [Cyclobacteriaceae bacterium]|nr:HEAT repeat domain-containing protein [Cyclobacteriaceae bacterium]